MPPDRDAVLNSALSDPDERGYDIVPPLPLLVI
jgi:hypothetical protein